MNPVRPFGGWDGRDESSLVVSLDELGLLRLEESGNCVSPTVSMATSDRAVPRLGGE
jgi:hypothetical protein